jgi:cytidylate kinase
MIIAVDGPAASGKGTLALGLARHYGLPHLDTGLLYRAVGLAVTGREDQPAFEQAAIEAAGKLDATQLGNVEALTTAQAGMMASRVAGIPEVRQALFALQRDFATQPGGAVLDGRDIGTRICPDADVKLFIQADSKSRMERRARQLEARGVVDMANPHGGTRSRASPVVAIEKDARQIIDVGLKKSPKAACRSRNSRRRPCRRASRWATKDLVEVYLERIENAIGEAVLSREKARREESWVKLERVQRQRARRRRHLRPGQGRLHGRPRRRRRLPAGQPGGHPPDARHRPADGRAAAVPDPEDGRRRGNIVVSRRAVLEETRAEAALGTRPAARGRPGPRRRGQEHHRLRCVRRPRRHRRPAARHRHRLAPRQPPVGSAFDRPDRQGPGHPVNPRPSASASA